MTNFRFASAAFYKPVNVTLHTCGVLALLLAQACPAVQAASIKLAWDASTDSRTAGYQIAYGQVSGRYTTQLDVGNQTQFNVTGLETGKAYYFAVSGYNSSKSLWSTYTNEAVARTRQQAQAQTQSQSQTTAPSTASGTTATVDYGGDTGSTFADAPTPSQKLNGIRLRAGWSLDNIQGLTTGGNLPAHGGNGGSETVIRFDTDEYLTSITGRHANAVSLITFKTNKGRSFGPYGAGLDPDGTPANTAFAIYADSGYEIGGFRGRAGSIVNAIGAIQRPRQSVPTDAASAATTPAPIQQPAPSARTVSASTPADSTVSVGNVSGGGGGSAFTDRLGAGAHLSGVRVNAGWSIDSVEAIPTSGSLTAHGGSGGNAEEFSLADGEYIVSIEGRYGNYISRIAFRTNTGRRFGPYGEGRDPDGTYAWGNFGYQAAPGKEIIGFTGRAGQFLDAIGIVERQR